MTAALDLATAALGDANVRAFLHVIGDGETSAALTEDDYRTINGGARFEAPPWAHPYARVSTREGGRAAGAFQFLGTTWGRCSDRLGLGGDFSPANQDVAAAHLIIGRGALAAVVAGDIYTAMRLLAVEWTSLPSLGLARPQETFKHYGGKLQKGSDDPFSSSQPAAGKTVPQPDLFPQQPEPAMPLLLALLPSILGLFAPRAQAAITKVTGQPDSVVNPFLADLFGKIASATGTPADQPVQGVAALQKAPAAVVAAVEDNALAYLDKIAPMLDKLAQYEAAADARTVTAQDAASNRAGAENLRPPLARNVWIAVASVSLVLGVAIVLEIALSTDHRPQNDLIVLFGTMVTYILARLGDVYGYAFGGTQPSRAADLASAAIGQGIQQAKK